MVNSGYESTQEIPWYMQGAPTIPLQYDAVPQNYADEGLMYSYSVRQWIHGREWWVRNLNSSVSPFIDPLNALVIIPIILTG